MNVSHVFESIEFGCHFDARTLSLGEDIMKKVFDAQEGENTITAFCIPSLAQSKPPYKMTIWVIWTLYKIVFKLLSMGIKTRIFHKLEITGSKFIKS